MNQIFFFYLIQSSTGILWKFQLNLTKYKEKKKGRKTLDLFLNSEWKKVKKEMSIDFFFPFSSKSFIKSMILTSLYHVYNFIHMPFKIESIEWFNLNRYSSGYFFFLYFFLFYLGFFNWQHRWDRFMVKSGK